MRNRFNGQLNTSRLVVPSQSVADHQLAIWMEANDLRRIIDGDEGVWAVHIQAQEIPDINANFHRALWNVEIKVNTQFTVTQLVEQGVLDVKKDARLIELAGPSTLPFHVRPVLFSCESLEAARLKIGQTVVDLKQKFQDDVLRKFKKDLFCQWLNEKRSFCERPDAWESDE